MLGRFGQGIWGVDSALFAVVAVPTMDMEDDPVLGMDPNDIFSEIRKRHNSKEPHMQQVAAFTRAVQTAPLLTVSVTGFGRPT